MTSIRSSSLILWLSVGVVGGVNVVLLRQNVALKQQGSVEPIEMSVGTVLHHVSGLDQTGNNEEIRFSDQHPRSLFLVFSPNCRFCQANRERWLRLCHALAPLGWRVVWFSRDPLDVTQRYLESNPVPTPVLSDPPHRTYAQLRMRVVPTTAVVSPNGTVQAAWRGQISDSDWFNIMTTLRRLDPRIPSSAGNAGRLTSEERPIESLPPGRRD